MDNRGPARTQQHKWVSMYEGFDVEYRWSIWGIFMKLLYVIATYSAETFVLYLYQLKPVLILYIYITVYPPL